MAHNLSPSAVVFNIDPHFFLRIYGSPAVTMLTVWKLSCFLFCSFSPTFSFSPVWGNREGEGGREEVSKQDKRCIWSVQLSSMSRTFEPRLTDFQRGGEFYGHLLFFVME